MIDPLSQTGICFNIQHYSVHDGEGIRTAFFLKGCPLHCSWCCNPESQSAAPELGYNAEKCLGCGTCLKSQTLEVMSREENGALRFHPDPGRKETGLADICPAGALVLYGREYTVGQLLEMATRESVLYALTGGGITLSGGEALAQPEFSRALLAQARRRRLNTAMETCGYYELSDKLDIFGLLDELFFDIKTLDASLHRRMTGKDNALILANLKALRTAWPDLNITVRTPVIPGVNDSLKDITEIARFVKEEVPGALFEPMRFHRFGEVKYRNLGRRYAFADSALPGGLFEEIVESAKKLVPHP